MIALLAVAIVVLAAWIVWLVSFGGLAGLVSALFLALCGLGGLAIWFWGRKQNEHLYRQLPEIREIRKPLTPANYSVRSNLDPPFFSFESQNYGDAKPRSHIKNVPIDRYLELQSHIDGLSSLISTLSNQLAEAKAEITIFDAEGQQIEAPTLLLAKPIAAESITSPVAPQPLFDNTFSNPKRGPRPPNVVIETLANTQQHISKLWRRG